MSKTPWQNGYWCMSTMPSFVFVIEGEKAEAKTMIALDYPDIESTMPPNTIKYGDFGDAREAIQ